MVIIILFLLIFICIVILCIFWDNVIIEEQCIKHHTYKNNYFIRKTSKNINLTNINCLVASVSTPENCNYWSLGVFEDDIAIGGVNMSHFLNYQQYENVYLIITKNSNCIDYIIKKYKIKKYKIVFTDKDTINIKYEMYHNDTVEVNLHLLLLNFKNILYEHKECEIDKTKINYNIENYCLFKRVLKQKNQVPIKHTISRKFIECMSFQSDIFIPSNNFEIFAVNHFRAKTALFSNVVIIDYESGKIVKFFNTGILSNNIYNKDKLEVRRLSFSYKKRVIAIENIYLFHESYKVDSFCIIPFVIYN